MAASTPDLTLPMVSKIMKEHGKLLHTVIKIDAMLLAELVECDVIDGLQSEDIQSIPVASDKRQKLFEYIGSKVESFISFCIVLQENRLRDDIVRDEFKLNLVNLRRQKLFEYIVSKVEISISFRIIPQENRARDDIVWHEFKLVNLKRQKKAILEKRKQDEEAEQSTTDPHSTVEQREEAAPPDEVDAPGAIIDNYVIYGSKGKNIKQLIASKMTSPHPTVDVDSAMNLENAVEAGFLSVFSGYIARQGFVPNEIMKKDLKHMVDVLKTRAQPFKKVLIAVLDSGIWTAHPRLKNFMAKRDNITDPVKDEPLEDKANHGTIMAGILVEFAAICVEILNFKIEGGKLRDQHAGLFAIEAWEVKTGRKVDIILTSHTTVETEFKARDDFDDKLVNLAKERIIICSASNTTDESDTVVRYPATHDHVLGIGSRDIQGNPSDHSTTGRALNFPFPGEQFISTSRPRLYPKETYIQLFAEPLSTNDWSVEIAEGTSFAAPHAAAAAAIILAYTEHELGPGYRKGLTRTKHMEELLMEVKEHDFNIRSGYGYPQLRKINRDMIKSKVEKMCPEMKVSAQVALKTNMGT